MKNEGKSYELRRFVRMVSRRGLPSGKGYYCDAYGINSGQEFKIDCVDFTKTHVIWFGGWE